MSAFKLRDLGEKLRIGLDKISPGTVGISWSLEDYNLKTNCITGILDIWMLEAGLTQSFSRMKTVLLLSDLDVHMRSMNYLPHAREETPFVAHVSMSTSVSLDDFPEIALSNYIKDAQETLNYEWNKQD